MNRLPIILLSVVIAVTACMAASCGKNSDGNVSPDNKNATLTVIAAENTGQGIPGFVVSTVPETATSLTDSTGRAVLTDLPFGTYTVNLIRDGYPRVTSTADLKGDAATVTFSFLARATIQFAHETKGLITGARVTAEPYGFSGVTDDQGRVTFTNMPVMPYTITVYREGLPNLTFSTTAPESELKLVAANHRPEVTLVAPANDSTYIGARPIMFIGSGTDIEDGVVPDSSLVWYSSRDGELGRGSRLVLDTLSGGLHTITLRGYDSEGGYGEKLIDITVKDFQLDTYFPIPIGETWSYYFLVPEFYVTSGDKTEYWVMNELSVRIYDGNLRSVTMVYDITRNGAKTHYSYTISDVIQNDGTGLAVFKTDELSSEWDTGNPYRTITVNTTYNPPYPLIRNAKALTPNSSSTFKTDLTVAWYSVYYGTKSATYYEYETITGSSTVGEEETVTTSAGRFTATPVMTNERGIERTVWFAKGIGPVKFQDKAFTPQATMALKDASLLRFGIQDKTVFRPVKAAAAPPTLHFDRNTPKGMRELHRFLSSIAPR